MTLIPLLQRLILFARFSVFLLLLSKTASAQNPASDSQASPQMNPPAWGRIVTNHAETGAARFEITALPKEGELALPRGVQHVIGLVLETAGEKQRLSWRLAPEQGGVCFKLPEKLRTETSALLLVETSDKTRQFDDGRIFLSATEASLEGGTLRLVQEPGNSHVTSWNDSASAATWNYQPTRWGMYDVELVYSAADGEGTELLITCAGRTFTFARPSSGGRDRFVSLPAGRFHLEKSQPFQVRVSSKALQGDSALNLKGVILRPAPEGKEPVQAADASVTLRASEAVTHSVLMRYEPAEIKNCLGYWANPKDWAEWEFTVTHPGAFDVEVWQGCGKGQGGSEVAVELDGQRIDFVVEETGHFQIFLPRRIGRIWLDQPGHHTLAIKPLRKKAGAVMDVRQVRLLPVPQAATANAFASAKRVLFLGDSITYGGQWVEFVETWFRLSFPFAKTEIINLGLPSETVSGLSERGHAGGSFPRPDLHERLDRALARIQPDLVVICYGMNDGIYFPFGEERFQKFQEGMVRFRTKASAAGAKIIHLTPPVFDPLPLKDRVLPAGLAEYPSPFAGYNTVLDRYSNWLLAQRANGWEVVDLHGPMNDFLAAQRRTSPTFTLSGDGVHPNQQGHWLMAREFLRHLGAPAGILASDSPDILARSHPRGGEILKLVQQRQRLLKDAWLTDTGHRRPGMAKGLPLPEAARTASGLAAQIHALADSQFPGKRSLWFGFDRFDFELNGRPILVVAPKVATPGKPWLWHGEFFGHKPEPDLALLGRGFHIVYTSVPDMLGSPDAVAHWNAVYAELTGKFAFAPKAALVGLSRGGLYVYNWAIANPDKTACIYADAPVCDLKSWPGGKGKGPGSARDWKLALEHYGFSSEAEALAFKGNPVDNLSPLAAAGVPLLHVYGDADEVVPWDENTGVIAERYRKLGGNITLIAKPGVKHHPHGLENPAPIVQFLWNHSASAEAKNWLASHGGGPIGADARPLIRKLGTVDLDLVETTPVVLNGRLWRFEWVRHGIGQQYWDNQRQTNYFRFRDPATGEVTAPFADGHEFGSAFVHDGVVYVTGTMGRDRVNMFASRDLAQWQSWPVLPAGRYGIFNTSVCKAADEFVLMFEIDKPAEEAGTPFTARFARSPDLRRWTLTPPECAYAKDRYSAPHSLRWLDGWFYNFYLEAHDGYEMRVVRSRDLVRWEASPLNPVLRASPEDKLIANPKLTDTHRARIANAANRNNSDIDFCEWRGRLVIQYSWGNQLGIEHLAEAVYDGSQAEFLQGWFPEK